MQVRALEQDDTASALALLMRGFPERGRAFWTGALARLFAHRERHGVGPIGRILSIKDQDRGILLTIGRDGLAPTVNLSSWYVDPEARWMAVRLMQKAMEADASFTDLSASPEARAVNEKLGFRLLSQGSVLVPTPVAALRTGVGARVLAHGDAALAGLSHGDAQALEEHRALGALTAVIETQAGRSPFIGLPTRTRGLPGAKVVLADRDSLHKGLGALARHLLARGKAFIEYDFDSVEPLPFGAMVSANRASFYARGAIAPGRIDHAYSELVFLHPELNEH